MPLTLVATPIGNPQDITLRGLEILKAADAIILEERKEGTQLLRHHGLSGKNYYQLNEHSDEKDLQVLVGLCRTQNIALMTDCGTPGFCDPGADLVRLCRKQKIPIVSAPGASSLMTLLSLAGRRIDQFLFRGFLSLDREERIRDWRELTNEKRPFVILDTPYRLQKTLAELSQFTPQRKVLIGLNLTQTTELVWEGYCREIKKDEWPQKGEFILLVYSAEFEGKPVGQIEKRTSESTASLARKK